MVIIEAPYWGLANRASGFGMDARSPCAGRVLRNTSKAWFNKEAVNLIVCIFFAHVEFNEARVMLLPGLFRLLGDSDFGSLAAFSAVSKSAQVHRRKRFSDCLQYMIMIGNNLHAIESCPSSRTPVIPSSCPEVAGPKMPWRPCGSLRVKRLCALVFAGGAVC